MAREIVVWCDKCLAQDVRTTAVEHSIGVALGVVQVVATKTVALCAEHTDSLKELADLIEEFGEPIQVELPVQKKSPQSGKMNIPSPEAQLAAYGTRKGRVPASGRPNQCLWCTLSYGAQASGFAAHLKKAHGFTGLTEAFGGTCPVCGAGEFEMMMAHVNKSHKDMGFTAIAEPFIWARDNGDPHGVYAAKLEQVGSLAETS